MRPRGVVHRDELEWVEKASPDERASFLRKRLARAAGGERLGCTLQRIPAGKLGWPLHHHFANEEAVFVLEGRGRARIGDDEFAIRAGDYLAFPVGPDHSHTIWNDSEAPLEVLCFSTQVHPDVVFYPDSQKVGVMAGSAPGAPDEDRELEGWFPLASGRDYWDGEPGDR